MKRHDFVVRAAVGGADHEAVYRGRHSVYVEELGAMSPRPDGWVRDAFDARPSTLNIIAEMEGRIVGGARFVADAGDGTPADAYFDFKPYLPSFASIGAGSMLWMRKEARGVRGLIAEMMAFGLSWCATEGLTHVLATVNPPVASRFAKVGYRRIGEPFFHGPDRLPVQPMLLDMEESAMRFAA